MGIRSLLELILIDACGDQGSFVRNISAFSDGGHISPNQRLHLEAIVEMGHAAAHRNFQPSVDDLKTAMDIVEQVIAVIYIHPGRATELLSVVPKRKPKDL